MHRTDCSGWQHSHDYALDSSVAERRTRIVIGITATMMVVEIAAGIAFSSMALLAKHRELVHVTLEVQLCREPEECHASV